VGPAELDRIRSDERFTSVQGTIDAVGTTEQLSAIATSSPRSGYRQLRVRPRPAGPHQRPVRRGRPRRDLPRRRPAHLEPVLDAYREVRDTKRFADRSANPGL
jgi:hypothetical protein